MKLLYIIFLSLLILFLSNEITAQINIDGTISDSDSNPINNALVEIFDLDDTTKHYSSITNESGYFLISNITGIETEDVKIPSDFIVLRNYPNPFNPSTIIYYELPKSENIEIRIYDILGREVRTLFNNFHKAGTYTLEWNGRNDWNAPVAAGVYFCRLKTKDNFKVHKMLLLDGGAYSLNRSNLTLEKERSNKLSKIKGIFNYSVRISGNDILESEFKYLSCSSDTTLILLVPKVLKTEKIG
ncbi:MAG: T9SS type A sorting domain-containing protein, partial [Melioribacteraceae bacterium]|nr:T9SS type A sorting domain-containing protein [Melioribacteraceae bacterium]